MFFLIFGWTKIPIVKSHSKTGNTFATIVICIRNEASNIQKLLHSIENQTYNKKLFELIIINDQSTDKSVDIINGLRKELSINISVYNLLDFFKGKSKDIQITSPKKMAISEAIKLAKGELIVCTDGDCFLGENWLNTIINYYETTGFKFISGPVTFQTNTLFDRLQTVEFASLIGTGAASIQLNMPNMCNGANIAYQKKAFEAVNGFTGFDSIPSGDDEFLMHKIAEKFPNQIGFLKDKEAIVTTQAQYNLSDFINQRKRWASKWNKYLNWKNTILAIFIFFINLSTIWLFISLIFGEMNNNLIVIFLLKLIVEASFIGSILGFLLKKNEVFYILLVQFLYPFYVVFTALSSLSKSYTWKGRNY